MNGLKIGRYYLNQLVTEAPALSEYSEEQYQEFASAGTMMQFPNERIYNAEPTAFAHFNDWEVVVGSVNDKIYKIQLLATTDNFNLARAFKKDTVKYINSNFGKYAKHADKFNTLIWDTHFGNIVLNMVKANIMYGITVTFTSNSIRDFQ